MKKRIYNIRDGFNKLDIQLNEANQGPLLVNKMITQAWTYLWSANGSGSSTYGPTDTTSKSYSSAKSIFFEINAEFKRLEKQVDAVKSGLMKRLKLQ